MHCIGGGVLHYIHSVFQHAEALPLAIVKVAVLPGPGFEPQTPVLRPERPLSTSNVLTTLLYSISAGLHLLHLYSIIPV